MAQSTYARMDFVPFSPKPSGIITILFTLEDTSGSLSNVLNVFKHHGISLQHIESRPSKNFKWEHEFLVELKTPAASTLEALQSSISKFSKNVQVIGQVPESTKNSITSIEVFWP